MTTILVSLIKSSGGLTCLSIQGSSFAGKWSGEMQTIEKCVTFLSESCMWHARTELISRKRWHQKWTTSILRSWTLNSYSGSLKEILEATTSKFVYLSTQATNSFFTTSTLIVFCCRGPEAKGLPQSAAKEKQLVVEVFLEVTDRIPRSFCAEWSEQQTGHTRSSEQQDSSNLDKRQGPTV